MNTWTFLLSTELSDQAIVKGASGKINPTGDVA